MKKTKPVPLWNYKLKTAQDIIKWYVNKFEDSSGVFKNEIPAIKMPESPKFTMASAHAFSKNFIHSLLP